MTAIHHALDRWLGSRTHRLRVLPVLVLMPHSRCDCRCMMCDIWKANSQRRELSTDDLRKHIESLRGLRVQRIVLSGGEALLHSNLWRLCELLASTAARLTLLTSGLALERNAEPVARHFDEVIVSLDGPPSVHDAIRGVAGAYDRIRRGLAALASGPAAPTLRARSVVQRDNFRHLGETTEAARALGVEQISFLAADVSSTAFNRSTPWTSDRAAGVALGRDEARELTDRIEAFIAEHAADLESRFIAESPDKLRDLGRYYLALHGEGAFPRRRCNAPWVSAVVEADGDVRPCFFHPAYGKLDDAPLQETLNDATAVAFRRRLDVARDPICQRCVCTLHLGPTATA